MEFPHLSASKEHMLKEFKQRLLNSDNLQVAKQLLQAADKAPSPAPDAFLPALSLSTDGLSLRLGQAFVPLLSHGKSEALSTNLTLMQQTLAARLGLVMPPIFFAGDAAVSPASYHISVLGCEVASGTIEPGCVLAFPLSADAPPLKGIPAADPIFGEAGTWIPESHLHEAMAGGYYVMEPLTLLVTHIDHVAQRHAYELVSRQSVSDFLQSLQVHHAVLLTEMDQLALPLSFLQAVIQQGVKEKTPLHLHFPLFVEAVLEGWRRYGAQSDAFPVICAFVRQRLARRLCEQVKTSDGHIRTLVFSPDTEAHLSHFLTDNELRLPPETKVKFFSSLSAAAKVHGIDPSPLVLVVSDSMVRHALSHLVYESNTPFWVFSAEELSSHASVVCLGSFLPSF